MRSFSPTNNAAPCALVSCVKVRFHSHSRAVSFKKALNIDWIFCPRWETWSCILQLDPCCHHVGIIQPQIFFWAGGFKYFPYVHPEPWGRWFPSWRIVFKWVESTNYFCFFEEAVRIPFPLFLAPVREISEPSTHHHPSLPSHFHRTGEALSAPARRSTSFAGLRHLAQPTKHQHQQVSQNNKHQQTNDERQQWDQHPLEIMSNKYRPLSIAVGGVRGGIFSPGFLHSAKSITMVEWWLKQGHPTVVTVGPDGLPFVVEKPHPLYGIRRFL